MRAEAHAVLGRALYDQGSVRPAQKNLEAAIKLDPHNARALYQSAILYDDRFNHTEALRLTERYHRRDVGHIDLQVTFDDPKAYTRPWTIPVEFDLVPDGQLIEYICENERDSQHLIGKLGEEFRVPAEVLAQYVGTYQGPASPSPFCVGCSGVVVSLEGNRLMIDPGAGKIPLIAHSENSFTMEGTGVDFVKDAKGAGTAMIQHWTEGDRRYARKK